jgi:BRCA1-associated protein
LTLDFSFLLTSQLESQRLYFEEKLSACEQQHVDSMKKIDQEMLVLWDDYRMVQRGREELQRELEKERKDRKILDKRLLSLQSRMAKLESDLEEERQINTSLIERQKILKDVELEKEKKIQDLTEQIQDLTFTIETLNRVENSPYKKEIQEGSIVMKPSGTAHRSHIGHKKRS